MALPWTKFQDFYLRLGFLKVLVGVLSPQRRSALNDAIIRKLEKPLFDEATDHADLWDRVKHALAQRKSDQNESRPKGTHATVAEALLVDGGCPSLLFAITQPTAYKVLDWAHDVQFVGRGNQITERGLILRRLHSERAFDEFMAGNVDAWNPFQLSSIERNFLLYHLIEIDEVTAGIIDRLGQFEPGKVLESKDAARLTCRTLISVLVAVKDSVQPRDILAFRTACELAATIAKELDEDASGLSLRPIRKLPRRVSPKARRKVGAGGVLREPRRANKNADHQTIPRFEQLVDLGFLTKPRDDTAQESEFAGRRRWRYLPTEACRRWSELRHGADNRPTPFLWHSFARTCLTTFTACRESNIVHDAVIISRYLWRAYEKVKRPVGPNPVDTVALFAMLEAIEDGLAIEIADFHRLLLTVKQQALMTEHAFFSSGNNINQMFIQLRPGFFEQVEGMGAMINSLMSP